MAKCGRKPLSEATIQYRKNRIIELHNQKHPPEKIAELLGLGLPTISILTRQLLKEGLIEKQPKQSATYLDLESERVQIIVAMVEQRKTLQDIGKVIGNVTRERARQLIRNIADQYGNDIFTPDNSLLTIQDVAEKLDIPILIIQRLCKNSEIKTSRRSAGKNATYIIQESELKNIQKHPLVTGARTCDICHETFNYMVGHGIRKVCAKPRCKKEYERRRKAGYTIKTPTLESLAGWDKILWEKLQNHKLPENEEWIELKQATYRTKLSKTQVHWLRIRNIVTIHPHPSKTWRGKPMATYAASEMEIARQVYEEFQRGKKAQ